MFGSTTKILEINNIIITEMVEYLKKTNIQLKQMSEAQDDINEVLLKICEVLDVDISEEEASH